MPACSLTVESLNPAERAAAAMEWCLLDYPKRSEAGKANIAL